MRLAGPPQWRLLLYAAACYALAILGRRLTVWGDPRDAVFFAIPFLGMLALIILFGTDAVTWCFLGGRQRWHAAQSLCVKCGYDLRASPARCPECGLPRAKGTRGVRPPTLGSRVIVVLSVLLAVLLGLLAICGVLVAFGS